MTDWLEKGANYCMLHGAEFALYYKEVTGKDVCPDCRSKLYEAYMELKNTQPMGVFKIKNKGRIQIHGTPDIYTNENITDEIAAKLIADNPARAAFFEPYGDEGQALINKAKKKK